MPTQRTHLGAAASREMTAPTTTLATTHAHTAHAHRVVGAPRLSVHDPAASARCGGSPSGRRLTCAHSCRSTWGRSRPAPLPLLYLRRLEGRLSLCARACVGLCFFGGSNRAVWWVAQRQESHSVCLRLQVHVGQKQACPSAPPPPEAP